MCSVELKFLKWGLDMQLFGHSYNSREEKSLNTGVPSALPVCVNDQPLQRIFLYTSALCGIILKII